jgi:hypothetical protein
VKGAAGSGSETVARRTVRRMGAAGAASTRAAPSPLLQAAGSTTRRTAEACAASTWAAPRQHALHALSAGHTAAARRWEAR